MIYPVKGWFEITEYYNKHVVSIAKFVNNKWLVRYPRPAEITYNQGSDFIVHEFMKSII